MTCSCVSQDAHGVTLCIQTSGMPHSDMWYAYTYAYVQTSQCEQILASMVVHVLPSERTCARVCVCVYLFKCVLSACLCVCVFVHVFVWVWMRLCVCVWCLTSSGSYFNNDAIPREPSTILSSTLAAWTRSLISTFPAPLGLVKVLNCQHYSHTVYSKLSSQMTLENCYLPGRKQVCIGS